MSVEDRLRSTLSRDADATTVEPERALEAVLRRHGRRRAARSAVVAVAAAAAVIAVVVGVRVWEAPRADVSPVTPSESTLVGEYVVDVPPSPLAGAGDLEGRWTVLVDPEGQLHIVAPPSFSGVVSGASYRVEGDLVHTDALVSAPGCQNQLEPGTYRWVASDETVTFSVVDDRCPARRTLLGGQPWERVP